MFISHSAPALSLSISLFLSLATSSSTALTACTDKALTFQFLRDDMLFAILHHHRRLVDVSESAVGVGESLSDDDVFGGDLPTAGVCRDVSLWPGLGSRRRRDWRRLDTRVAVTSYVVCYLRQCESGNIVNRHYLLH